MPIDRATAIPAVVTAGDRRAAKAVYGESKLYLDVAGLPLVAWVVATLQRVPEVSEVWVVGNEERLRAVFEREDLRAEIHKPLHIVEQFRNLYENCWETFRRLLPGAPPEGRDPEEEDLDTEVLYLSGDIPLASAREISAFIHSGWEAGCDYALGLVTEDAIRPFYPKSPDQPGIRVAYYNLREARLRQSNLHLARPARIGNRHYVEDMYEHRHQREFGKVVRLAWRLLRAEQGGPSVVFFYWIMHLGGFADRKGWRRLADAMRRIVSISRVENALSNILRTRVRFVVTELGGCAIDIDTEAEYDAVRASFEEWQAQQRERAEFLYGAGGAAGASGATALPASARAANESNSREGAAS